MQTNKIPTNSSKTSRATKAEASRAKTPASRSRIRDRASRVQNPGQSQVNTAKIRCQQGQNPGQKPGQQNQDPGQARIVAAIRVTLKQRHSILMGAHLHGVILRREILWLRVTQLGKLLLGGIIQRGRNSSLHIRGDHGP